MATVHAAGNTGAEAGLETAQGHNDRPGRQAQGLGGFCCHLRKNTEHFWTKYVLSPGAHRRCTWPPGGCGQSSGPRHNESLAQPEPGERGLMGPAEGPEEQPGPGHVLTGTRHNSEGRSESCSESKKLIYILL